jgi:3-mercaptopyruvate sulfurtransferase SseA/CubicO group peptidase (beta-lactamase class C family)
MSIIRERWVAASCALLVLGAVTSPATAEPPANTGPWLEYVDPAQAGFSRARLDEARAFADSLQSGAVIAVCGGNVVAAFGAVDRNFMAHSIRKSLAGSLYGIAAAEGVLRLDATLAQLGIDDDPPLTEGERQARVRDLLAARSGVYHGAAYAPSEQDEQRPARGAHPPGTFWYYNNWDFNTAEWIYAQATGTDVIAAFGRRIAEPTGMEDYRSANGFLAFEPSLSRFPAHTMRISARDLARFGQLYLQRGAWGGRQLVPQAWVAEGLRPLSDLGDGAGYGLLWWTYAPGALGDKYPVLNAQAVAVARGSGGHALFVVPGLDLVVVHRADTDNGRSVTGPQVWALAERIAAARERAPAANPALRRMQPVPLASQLPEPPAPALIALDPSRFTVLVGQYEPPHGGPAIRVFAHEARLFMFVPGRGEAELLALSPTVFTVKVVPGVRVEFAETTSGASPGVVVTLGRERFEARRVEAPDRPSGVRRLPLIASATEVSALAGDGDLMLLHVGDRAGYDAAHLPGARFVTLDALSRPRGEGPLRLEMADHAALVAALAGLGVSDRSLVVVYFGSDWATPAARVFLALDYLGLGDRVSYLDGGLPAWKVAGLPVTSAATPPPTSPLPLTPRVRPDALADLAAVAAALTTPGVSVVDARDPEFYTGANGAQGRFPRPGHITGARTIPFGTLLAEDGRFKTRDQLESIFRDAGVRPGDTVVSYCHIGQQASLVYLVARVLGHDARLYDGSFEEWSPRVDLPVSKVAP